MSTIVTRTSKGTALTWTEADTNLINLNTDKTENSAFNAHVADTAAHGVTGDIVGTSDTQTLTNKSVSLTDNTVSGTLSEFNTALSDDDFVSLTGSETLTNKTLTSPVLNTADINTPDIDGGTADSVVIGGSIPAAGSFTDANAEAITLDAVAQALTGPTAPIVTRTYGPESDRDPSWIDRMSYMPWYQAWGKFPARRTLVLEAAKLWIFNADTGEVWGSFAGVVPNWAYCFWNDMTDVTYANGVIYVTDKSAAGGGLIEIRFAENKLYKWYTAAGQGGTYKSDIVNYDSGLGFAKDLTSFIVNPVGNAVAVTTLPNAPLNYAGLPENTKLVMTDGGPSWITSNGDVWDGTGGIVTIAGDITEDGYSFIASTSKLYCFHSIPTADIAMSSADYIFDTAATSGPKISGTIETVTAYGSRIYVGTDEGLFLIHYNPHTPASSMVSQIAGGTKAFNTGYNEGDSRLAALCGIETGAVAATSNLAPDLTSYADEAAAIADGWTKDDPAWSFDASNDEWDCDGTQASLVGIKYTISGLIVGEPHTLSFNLPVTAGSIDVVIGGVLELNNISDANPSVTFIPSSASLEFNFRANVGFIGSVKAIDVWLATPDHIKGNGLKLISDGGLTRTALGGAGSLAMWSGFDTNNHIEQPYTSDLDFGTGNFYSRMWVVPQSTATQQLAIREDLAQTGGGVMSWWISAATGISFDISDDNLATKDSVVSGSPVVVGTVYCVEAWRDGDILYLAINNKIISTATIAQAAAGVNNASAELWLGTYVDGSFPFSGEVSYFHISATIPTTEQRTEIYRTEKAIIDGQACVLPGATSAVVDLDYNDERSELFITQADYTATFRDLVRVDSQASQAGTLTTGGSTGGIDMQGGSGGAYMDAEAIDVKAELLHAQLALADALRGPESDYFDEEVTNGTFDTDTDWTKGSGWTIGSGVASRAVWPASSLDQAQDIDVGERKVVVFDIANYSAGTFTPVLGGTSGTARSANGTYTEALTVGSTDLLLSIAADSSASGDIDNIRLLDADPNDLPSYRAPAGKKPVRVFFDGVEQRMDATVNADPTTSPKDWVLVYDGDTYWATPTTLPAIGVDVKVEWEDA